MRFVWENAPSVSLAYDLSDGGLELALREAAAWSGAELVPSWHKDEGGVIVAATDQPAWHDVVELGVA